MLDGDIILGIKREGFLRKAEKISYGVLTQSYNHMPCGTPVMVAVNKRKGDSAGCVTSFSPRANGWLGFTHVPRNIVAIMDKEPLCEKHKTKDIEEFDYRKFESIIESTKKHGGTSFVSAKKSASLSMLDSIKSIIREYKYSSLFMLNHFSGRFLSGDDDSVLSILSFFDLIHCVPMFNLRKVDGLAISFSQVLRKHSELAGQQINTFRLDIVVSNYKDNLFTIDGTTVDTVHPISNSIYKEIRKWIESDLPVKKDKLKANLSKKNRYGHFMERPPEEVVMVDMGDQPVGVGTVTLDSPAATYTSGSITSNTFEYTNNSDS